MVPTNHYHVCAAREIVMSERVATADITEATDRGVTEPQAAEPELAAADLLVEEVSIDGMCGVY
jgi:mycofactocin precursor